MSGRYAFSLPEPRQRDGWFRLGPIDMTTTAIVVALSVGSMVAYALSPDFVFKGAFVTELVRKGEVWRTVTWPIVNPPLDIWALVGVAIYWFLGHMVEDEIGKKPMAWLCLAMAVIPTAIVTLLNVANDTNNGRWSAYSFTIFAFSLAAITIFGLEHPNARFFFGIPAWVISAAFVFIEVMRDVGARAWAQLLLVLLVIVVGCVGARQRGMLDVLDFVPRWRRLAGPAPSPYGEVRSAKPKRSRGSRRSKGASGSSAGSVVTGPWEQPSGPTPLEQAELDVLLDKISATGIDSLTPMEKDRLNALSRKMRGG